MIYIDLDASVMRLHKRKSSPADLMHSPISKSDHSGWVLKTDAKKCNLKTPKLIEFLLKKN